jgi:hypothetical protein
MYTPTRINSERYTPMLSWEDNRGKEFPAHILGWKNGYIKAKIQYPRKGRHRCRWKIIWVADNLFRRFGYV